MKLYLTNSTLSSQDVLRIRDDLWFKIYSSSSVEKSIRNRFGDVALDTVKFEKDKIKRRLLS